MISVTVNVGFKPPKELLDLTKRLSEFLDNPAVIDQILRRAAAETLIAAYRKRFYARLPELLNMQQVEFERAAVGMPSKMREGVERVRNELDNAEADGDRELAAELRAKARNRESKLVEALQREERSALSTGKFRQLAIEVINLIASVEAMDIYKVDGKTRLGIGRLAELNQIETPSATPDLTGHETSSDMTTMWRQLEFGTGIHSKDPVGNPGSEFTEGDGTWWYGPAKGRGLHLQGTPGAHAVFDHQAVAYADDAMRFESVFLALVDKALGG